MRIAILKEKNRKIELFSPSYRDPCDLFTLAFHIIIIKIIFDTVKDINEHAVEIMLLI